MALVCTFSGPSYECTALFKNQSTNIYIYRDRLRLSSRTTHSSLSLLKSPKYPPGTEEESWEMEGPHVLVFPYWLQGHINPMLQFSKRLVSKGLKVTLLTTKPSTDHVIQKSPSSPRINIGFIEFPEGAQTTDLDEMLDLFKTLVSHRLGKFIEALVQSQPPPQFLVYDSAMPWALDVARGSGIDAAPFFTQPWSVNAVYYHLHNGSFKLPLQEPVLQLPSMPALEACSDVPSFLCGAGPYPGLFRLLISQFSNLKRANWIFCNTFQKLEQEVIAWMESEQFEIRCIGPTIPSVYLDGRLQDDTDYGVNLFESDVDEWCTIKWLDSKEAGSVVYAAFGSLAALEEEQMQELAWGIKRTSRPFLWVVRESEQKKLPKEFMKETRWQQQGLIVSWSPQIQVLGHRAVGCFVTHCGWNSAVEALSLGVPMVAVPQWSDQLLNAKFVSDVWEVGRRVKVNGKNGVCSREEVERCIREVMEGEMSEVVKKNCCKWKEMAAEAVSEGGSSDKNINDFVAKLCQQRS